MNTLNTNVYPYLHYKMLFIPLSFLNKQMGEEQLSKSLFKGDSDFIEKNEKALTDLKNFISTDLSNI